ncbi:MAG: acetyl-CoA decarbonylase/synthase complex subunit gamma [Candidatus Heimdallarchaeota archaeon]|nr:acetyl-CoA decarbonylase/synthase complex subunit gamma [Candidatus Heimdallarchaeota archaeon]
MLSQSRYLDNYWRCNNLPNALGYYKLLPKTNCGECGVPTCLAFAMRLAANSAKASDCPYLDKEIQHQLNEQSLPAVKEICLGKGKQEIQVGGETVFYRHEKKFNNPTAICIGISDQESRTTIDHKLQQQGIERLAEQLTTNMVALINDSGKKEPFIELVKHYSTQTVLPVIILSENVETLKEAVTLVQDTNPAIGLVTDKNKEELLELASQYSCGVILSAGNGIEQLGQLVKKAENAGISKILLDCSGTDIFTTISNQVMVRWKAVKEKNRTLGYPIISFPGNYTKNPSEEMLVAGLMLGKYSSIVVTRNNELNLLVPLLVLRQNIYTDPQKPIQVTPQLYSIGKVTEDSPVYMTTNFSLTYFTVSMDIESSNYPGYLLVVDTEGTSVLTAFAADKINAEKIAQAIDDTKLESKVAHRKLIIPGYLSPLSSKIEEKTQWEVLVGPTDSAEISFFLKKQWRNN